MCWLQHLGWTLAAEAWICRRAGVRRSAQSNPCFCRWRELFNLCCLMVYHPGRAGYWSTNPQFQRGCCRKGRFSVEGYRMPDGIGWQFGTITSDAADPGLRFS